MPHADDLFDLIRSLSTSEKRHFRIHAEKLGNKLQYEKLYDALNTWPADEYDEKEFRKKHKGKAFIKNLASDKNYLRELILKVIRQYGSESDPEFELPEMIQSIRLLINKGLYNQVGRMIERALRLAEEREQYHEMLAIIDQLLRFHRNDPAHAPYDAWQLEQMDKDILERITLIRQAIYLRTHMTEIHAQGQWKAREREARDIMGVAMSMSDRPNLPRRAELSLLNVRQIYLMHHHRYTEALSITAEWIEKIERAPSPFDYSADQYRVTLANYLHCALKADRLDLYPATIAKIKSIKTRTEKEAAECFRVAVQAQLSYVLNLAKFEEADSIISESEAGLKRYKRFISLPHILNFHFNTCLIYFIQKKYDKALQHTHEYYYHCGRDESRIHTTIQIRCVEWMCQYSLGMHTITDSSLRNLKRHLADRDIKGDFFEALIQYFAAKIKEVGSRPTSYVALEKKIADSSPPAEWGGLKLIASAWIHS